jgi:hypothetical protein
VDNGTTHHTDTVKGMDMATNSDAFGITSSQSSSRAETEGPSRLRHRPAAMVLTPNDTALITVRWLAAAAWAAPPGQPRLDVICGACALSNRPELERRAKHQVTARESRWPGGWVRRSPPRCWPRSWAAPARKGAERVQGLDWRGAG